MQRRKSKIRILYICPISASMGGISRWANILRKNGLPDSFESDFVDNGIINKRGIFETSRLNFSEIKRTSVIFWRLIKKIVLFNPDIVHLCCSLSPYGVFRDLFCALISRLFSKRIITHYRGNVVDFQFSKFHGLSGHALKLLINTSSVNILLNNPSLNIVNELGKQKEKNYALPNYFDDSLIAVNKEKTDNSRFQAIYVGGITYQKGVFEIVEISASYPDINFILIGPILNDFARRFESLPANLRVLPHMRNVEILKELSKSDFFIFPSHSEGFPNSVLEAMISGLPVVATKVGAIPEMIDEGKGGFLYEPKNIEQMKQAINNLLSNNLEQMGRYNFDKAKNNYSYSIVIKKLCEIYQEVLK